MLPAPPPSPAMLATLSLGTRGPSQSSRRFYRKGIASCLKLTWPTLAARGPLVQAICRFTNDQEWQVEARRSLVLSARMLAAC